MHDDDKRLAAEAAVAEIRDSMLVGIGTGSTVAFAIRAIAARLGDLRRCVFFSTSIATDQEARDAGIPIGRFALASRLDLTIDGADEIDPGLRVIKGAGGALLREKIVAEASDRMVVIADGSKRAERLGAAALPVEVLPFARSFVAARLAALGAEPVLRMAEEGAWRSDQGNIILDCHFVSFPDPGDLAVQLQAIPGVMGHGLFVREVDAAYVADRGVVTKMERNPD
ncbi:MAG: ribose-5-phosphate isomerase RpiA [Sphingomonas sp.]|uniref:ribose-5-phosphate isomerase RpiA n=1 Tax=Sphingomonas sp. TaxID=28214 RepID=UPI003F81C14B